MKFNDAYSQMFPGYPDAVSLQQAAEMLGLNRHTVGELIRSRRLFALKIGRTYRIPGNFEKAIEILRERGLATAAKKASRVAAEGMVYADYCPKCKVGVVIEVNAETDFVAKNDKFVDFVKEATKVIYIMKKIMKKQHLENIM